MTSRPSRSTLRALGLTLLWGLGGCAGEMAVVASMAFGMTLGAWWLAANRSRQNYLEAERLKRALASGQHRQIETTLRRQLMLAAAGEAVAPERQWVHRVQLAGMLVAEWRLDEAREIYGTTEDDSSLPADLRALATYGHHEIAVLTEQPDEERLAAIRRDRDRCLEYVPPVFRPDAERYWQALEGLCLVRMGRAREAVDLLGRGLETIEYNPARVVYLFHLAQAYEQIGERQLAATHYEEATNAFPGTRLASEAQSRLKALAPAGGGSMFRGMLPEAPSAQPSTALVPAAPSQPARTDDDHDDDDDR